MAFLLFGHPLCILQLHQIPYKLSFVFTTHSQRFSLTQTPTSPLHRKTTPSLAFQHVSGNDWSFEQRMEEALNVLDLMEAQGMKPEPSLFCILLKSCAEAGNLEFGKTIHSKLIGTKLEKDAYIVNNLITLYAKCGCLDSARKVFDEMPHRNEVSWTSVISMYSHWGFHEEALQLYNLMKVESGVRPNAFTYTIALNLCAKLRNLKMGIEIHEDIVEDGCESDDFIVTALIDMYSKCGRIDSARRVFKKISEPTIAACTAMIDGYNNNNQAKEAMRLIRRILHQGLDVKVVRELGFTCMIRSCTVEAAYRQGQEIHAHIIKSEYELGAQTLSALVMLYERCDKMVLARCLFDKLVVKNEELWGKMISGNERNGMNQEALEIYTEMVREGVQPSSSAFSCALKACVGILGLKEGKEIQGRAIKVGYGLSDDSVVATLSLLYDECRLPEEVQKVTKIHRSQNRVNKPYLPIAAGDISVQSVWPLVIFFIVAGVLIVGLNFGLFITSLYCLGLFLGTIYSVPPLRMKKYTVAAFLIIATDILLTTEL